MIQNLLFKKCSCCRTIMSHKDEHSLCLLSLIETHYLPACRHCQQFTKMVKNERVSGLKTALAVSKCPAAKSPAVVKYSSCLTLAMSVLMEPFKRKPQSLTPSRAPRSNSSKEIQVKTYTLSKGSISSGLWITHCSIRTLIHTRTREASIPYPQF